MIITGAEVGTASPAGRLEINITVHSFNEQWHCKTMTTYSKHLQVGQQVYSNHHDKKPNKNNKYYYAEEIRGLLEKYPTFFFMRTPDGL